MADVKSIEVEIDALGARALALVLKHEWCGWEELAPDSGGDGLGDEDGNLFRNLETLVCPECRWAKNHGHAPECPCEGRGHAPECEWGKLVAEVKKMRGGT